MACLDTTSEQILYYKIFVGQGTHYIHLTTLVCVGETCEKLLLSLCAVHTESVVGGRRGRCLCVRGGAGGKGDRLVN